MRRIKPLACAGWVVALAIGLSAADVRVTPLARDGRVWVTFELADGFTAEVRDAIKSGLSTRFTYDVELRRSVPFWPDRTLEAVTIAVSVTFDNLTRRHQLSRMLDGRMDASRVTEDQEDVRRWLTLFEREPLFQTGGLEPNTEYYVRVRAHTQPHDSLFFWPWGRSAISGNANFTFLP
jgi:hypothetical protein